MDFYTHFLIIKQPNKRRLGVEKQHRSQDFDALIARKKTQKGKGTKRHLRVARGHL